MKRTLDARYLREPIRSDSADPVFVGSGDIDYKCPYCGHLLAKNVEHDYAEYLVQCFRCGSFIELVESDQEWDEPYPGRIDDEDYT
jgi:DNA-directed RNA polymerase subunit RPC12/RpoP